VLDGFPAEVLALFRLYSLTNQALMWLVIGATFGCLAAQRKGIAVRSRATVMPTPNVVSG
jgi:hypothetical protein